MTDAEFKRSLMPEIKPKRKKRTMPSERSMRLLRKEFWTVAMVERWNPWAGPPDPVTGKPTGIRQDLFGCIDLVAVKAEAKGVLAVQATSMSNLTARINKAFGLPITKIWLQAGNRFEFHGWVKRPVTKKRKREIWEVARREIYLIPPSEYASGCSIGWREIEEDPF